MSKEEKNVKPKSDLSESLKKGNNVLIKNIKKLKKIRINGEMLKYVVGAILVILIIMGLGKLVFKDKDVLYPVVFNTSEGDLYLIENNFKNGDDPLKLAVSESVSNIKYANTTERYVLFKKDTDLYLFDAKKDEETTKVAENVKSYSFSLDDKYVLVLDNDDNLNVYNYKNSTKIESDVSEIIDVSKDKVIYEKDNVIYIRSVNPKKEDREKVTAEFGSYIQFSEDGKNVIYIDKDGKLVVHKVSNNKSNKIAEDVKSYYCDNESCLKMVYIVSNDGKTIYYYDGKKSTKIASGIYAVLAVDIEHKQIVYSTTENNKYTIHFQTVGKEEAKVEDGLTSVRTLKIFNGKEMYYITGKNEVKYVKINGNKLDKPKSLAADVTGYLYTYKNGFAYVADVDSNGNGTLFFTNGGKAKKIDSNINSSLITVNKDGSKIYYFKDYDKAGTLYATGGSKKTKIDENVYTFSYINDKLIYYIKDYSNTKSRGDLFIYRKGKTERIYEGVSRIASSPVSYKIK